MPKIRVKNPSRLKKASSGSRGAVPQGRCPVCNQGTLISRRVPSGPPISICTVCQRRFQATNLSA